MHQSILRKSTMQRERKKIHKNKTIKLHLDTNQPWLRRARIGGLRGPGPAARLRNVYVTSQLPASFCRAAMGMRRCITAIRSSRFDQLSVGFKACFPLRKHLEGQGPSFSETAEFIKRKMLVMVSIKSVQLSARCPLWDFCRSNCVSTYPWIKQRLTLHLLNLCTSDNRANLICNHHMKQGVFNWNKELQSRWMGLNYPNSFWTSTFYFTIFNIQHCSHDTLLYIQ